MTLTPRIRLIVAAALLLAVMAERARTQDSLSSLPAAAPAPVDNPTTPEKVELGRLLFWDPVLSGNREVACATCHHPDFAYADPLDLPIGVTGVGFGTHRKFAADGIPFVRRNSPPLVNVGFVGLDEFGRVDPSTAQLFWDTRVQSLERQAFFPIRTFEEMRGSAAPEDRAVDDAVSRVAAIPQYRQLFAAAFAGDPTVSADNLGRALASFQRTLVAADTAFDRFMRGDATAMTPAQRRGLDAFVDAGCVNCHRGAMLSDFKIHALGLPDNPKLAASDSGVHGTYGFRTPSLRNLALTAPYMHNGTLPTLEAVLDFYESVQRGQPRRILNPNMPAGQTAFQLGELEIGGRSDDIIAFLGALDDDRYDRRKPARVPSGLEVGGR